MLHSYIIGPDDCAQIYDGQIFPDPPDLSIFNGGGGSRIADKNYTHLDGSRLSAQIYDQCWISDPPIHSVFNGGGGSRMCDKQCA
jgi:hypothetical protein